LERGKVLSAGLGFGSAVGAVFGPGTVVVAAFGRGGEVFFFIGYAGSKLWLIEPTPSGAESNRARKSKNDAVSNLTLPALNLLKQGRSQESGPVEGRCKKTGLAGYSSVRSLRNSFGNHRLRVAKPQN
jgi:hypothetical protein